MKTIVSALIALSVLAGVAAPASALDAKTFYEQQDRMSYGRLAPELVAATWHPQLPIAPAPDHPCGGRPAFDSSPKKGRGAIGTRLGNLGRLG